MKRWLWLSVLLLLCSVAGATNITDAPENVRLYVNPGVNSKYVVSIFDGGILDGEHEAWSFGHWHISFGYPHYGTVYVDVELPHWKAARIEWLINADMIGKELDDGAGCYGVVNRHDVQNALWKLAGLSMNRASCVRTMLVRLARESAHKEDWYTCGERRRFILVQPEGSLACPLPTLGFTVPAYIPCENEILDQQSRELVDLSVDNDEK